MQDIIISSLPYNQKIEIDQPTGEPTWDEAHLGLPTLEPTMDATEETTSAASTETSEGTTEETTNVATGKVSNDASHESNKGDIDFNPDFSVSLSYAQNSPAEIDVDINRFGGNGDGDSDQDGSSFLLGGNEISSYSAAQGARQRRRRLYRNRRRVLRRLHISNRIDYKMASRTLESSGEEPKTILKL